MSYASSSAAGAASGAHPSVETLKRLTEHFVQSLGETVEWYYAAMPAYYLRTTPSDEQMRHIEMLHSARRGGEGRLAMLDDTLAGKVVVLGRPADHSLLEVVGRLGERAFHRAELHLAGDASQFLHAFVYRPSSAPAGFNMPEHRAAIIAACHERGDATCIPRALVERYLDAADQGYLARSAVERIERHVRAWVRLAEGEDQVVAFDGRDEQPAATRIMIATARVAPKPFLRHLGRVLRRADLRLRRGYVDVVPDAVDAGRQVLLSSIYVATADGRSLDEAATQRLTEDLEALRRLADDELADLYADGIYSLTELEILRAGLVLVEQLLGPDHPYLEVAETGHDLLRAEPALCRAVAGLLAQRFHPQAHLTLAAWQTAYNDLLAKVRVVEPPVHALVLDSLLAFVAHVRLTNVWRPARLGFACFLDPALLPEVRFPQRPHGLTLFAGPAGRGVHVRFRPSARGGLRLLLPRTAAQYHAQRAGLLKEVYDLAWAQQLKNKDIPEGGSKCIALVARGGDADALVRQVADGLLDLLVPPTRAPEVIGAHGAARKEEIVFLGPDENMTPPRIVWVAERARQRGMPNHLTLMSSKPGTGINHKEFGVTSEGIFRWIVHTLPMVGITDDQPYTVSMTGGPDGDLGGNLIRILHREHATRCRIVAIADGTGHAADPDGLDWPELLRLVGQSQGIAAYRADRLRSRAGRVVPAIDKASEQARYDCHNSTSADLFVPCGGRPYTINDQNWKRFLDETGKPRTRAMVEGANIFITSNARQALEDAGLVVIKDSSANKGGVICSSYEVLAGLVMGEDAFVAHKTRYVSEVIDLLRARADAEARALFTAWVRRGRSTRLSELSQQLSEEINRVSGLFEVAVDARLEEAKLAPAWQRHLYAHCPAVLVETCGAQILSRIPRAHRIAILAKRLASQMVYREGLTWCRTYLQPGRVDIVVGTYLEAEAVASRTVVALRRLNLPDGEELARVIANSSPRELVRERLGQEF